MNAAEQIDDSQPMRPEAHEAASHMVTRLFDHWRLNESDRTALLGRTEHQHAVDEAVEGHESAERIGHLLAIHSMPRTLFPQNQQLAYAWMSTPNRGFGDRPPVAVAREQGLDGLRAVRAYLERSIGA